MVFQIDNSSGRPVYQQVMDQVKRDVAMGRLAPGDRLPTVREVAASLAINPNTIAKAYRLLEQEGIIVTRAGAGAFVGAMDSGLNRSVKKRILAEQLERIVVEAVHMQVDRATLVAWMEEVLKRFESMAEQEGTTHE